MQRATDVVLAFPQSAVPASLSASVGDYSYRAITIRPEIVSPRPKLAEARELVIAMDSSRSALENRALSLELVSLVLAELGPKDRFALFAHDIALRTGATGMMQATDENVRTALATVESLEFDGASDLGATLSHAQSLASGDDAQIIYVGDGTPSWGNTSQQDLVAAAKGLSLIHI